MKRVLIIGASGFIGKKLFNIGKSQKNVELFGTAFKGTNSVLFHLDVRNAKEVDVVVHRVQPDTIIYACGVSNVDRAEMEQELTDDLNSNALRYIAHCFQGHLIYLSTHYVFDGTNPPYSKNDAVSPVNYYGKSKSNGENLTKKLFPKYSIVRMATLYGYNDAHDRKTFVTQVIHELSIDKPLYIDNEMGRSPILIDEVGEHIFELVRGKRLGVFQFAAETSITKYAWARAIAREFGYDPGLIHSLQEHPEKIQPIAKRSKNPRMVSSYKMFGVKEGLKRMHEQMITEVEMRFEDKMEYFDVDGNYLGTKSRSNIHRNGNFHMAVQAFIVRKGNQGQLQVLSQHRRIVDIAKSKWDHSTAVQMLPEDKRDPLMGILRGLELELSVGKDSIKQIHLVSDGITMRSSRKYGDEPSDLYNREFVFVTVVELKNDTNIRPNPVKIGGLKWIDWEELVPAVLKDASHFTKNLRHNFVNTALARHIKKFSLKILDIEAESPQSEETLIGSAYYSPPNNEDLALSLFASGKAIIEHLTMAGHIERTSLDSESSDIIDALLKQPNLLPQFLYDKGLFGIKPEMIPAPDTLKTR